MTQLEFLFLAALISGAASYICSRRRKGKKLCATRRNLYCATGIVSSALMALLIGMAATAAIRLCVSYGRIGAAAEAVSDAIVKSDLTDMADIMMDIMKDIKKEK